VTRVVEEQVSERAMIRATPERLFAILTDFEQYPDWSAAVKAVQVLQRDDQGRGTEVAFQVAAFGRSTCLTLRYDYRSAPERFSWAQESGDLTRGYDGWYSFEAAGSDGEETEVRYQLRVDLKVPLPGFVRRRAEGRLGSKVLRELKARAEV
jgi:ribosome-associated toxin RatA of RatAB toxin-antitoxin module